MSVCRSAAAPSPEGKSTRSGIAWLVAIPALLWVPIRLVVRGLSWLLEHLARYDPAIARTRSRFQAATAPSS